MIDLIDHYLAGLGERNLVPTGEVRDLLLDLRLTYMELRDPDVTDMLIELLDDCRIKDEPAL